MEPSHHHLTTITTPPITSLNPDTAVHTLSYLDVRSLHNLSLSGSHLLRHYCQLDELWKIKLTSRWNITLQHEVEKDFYTSYKNAYANPHDLWVRHVNCTSPDDGLLPGRCCIPTTADDEVKLPSKRQHLCPTCRYNNDNTTSSSPYHQTLSAALQRERTYSQKKNQSSFSDPLLSAHRTMLSSSTPTTLLSSATHYSLAKWCRHLRLAGYDLTDPGGALSRRLSEEEAFGRAATFHRRIETDQYRREGGYFLKDLLFFWVGRSLNGRGGGRKRDDCDEKEERRQRDDDGGDDGDGLEELLGDTLPLLPDGTDTHHHHVGGGRSLSDIGPSLEIASHSWHVIELINPSFNRSIIWRVWVQRSECFTVFPSEGTLGAGERCMVVFGVRGMGSLLGRCFWEVDVMREEANPILADIYSTESHLPFTPFCIRYIFAPTIPCHQPPTPHHTRYSDHSSLSPSAIWSHPSTRPEHIRSIYLNAHVNGPHYSLEEFHHLTLQPFEKGEEDYIFLAPQLSSRGRGGGGGGGDGEDDGHAVFQALKDFEGELDEGEDGDNFRTEKKCDKCGRDWGVRWEELGRVHLLRRLVCEFGERRRGKMMRVMCRVMGEVKRLLERGDGVVVRRKGRDILNQCKILRIKKMNRIYKILHHIHTQLMYERSSPILTPKQSALIFQYQLFLEELLISVHHTIIDLSLPLHPTTSDHDNDDSQHHSINISSINKIWKVMGVYRHPTITTSVLTPHKSSLNPLFKLEPDYLDTFRRLEHTPGLFRCGSSKTRTSSNKATVMSCPNGDLYKDDLSLSIVAALGLVFDPKCLVNDGVFDGVPFPGGVIRSPLTMGRELFMVPGIVPSSAVAERSMACSQQHISSHRFTPRLLWNEIDPEGYQHILRWKNNGHHNNTLQKETEFHFASSLERFINGVPPPGVGWFTLSTWSHDENTNDDNEQPSSSSATTIQPLSISSTPTPPHPTPHRLHPPPRRNNNNNNNMGLMGLLTLIYLGFTDDDPPPAPPANPRTHHNHPPINALPTPYVHRTILIAAQWLSNTLLLTPLISTLFYRSVLWMTPFPVDYHFDGLPYTIPKRLRYLNQVECGYASVIGLIVWLVLGRYCERTLGWTFERSVMEEFRYCQQSSKKKGWRERVVWWSLRVWDWCVPMVLQRWVFLPSQWNVRMEKELRDYIVRSRNEDFREHRTSFHADYGVSRDIGLGRHLGKPIPLHARDSKEQSSSSSKKFIIGLLVALASFSASSPHFMLNLLTIFYGSVAFGLTMSIQSMSTGKDSPDSPPSTISGFRSMEMPTFIIALFLIGQLIGCSGGSLFLAEFVVTAVSVLLGGAATISWGAIESWIRFLCFSTTALWGYLIARVGVVDGMRYKRCSGSAFLLLASLVVASGLWIFCLVFWDWEIPTTSMIVRNTSGGGGIVESGSSTTSFWLFERRRKSAGFVSRGGGGGAARRFSPEQLQ